MVTLHSYEGKNLEVLKETCQNELGLPIEKIYFRDTTTDAGLFKGKKIILEAITEDEIISSIKEFLKELGQKMNLDIKSEIKIQDNIISIVIVSDNNNILIGKDGKTMNAINILLRQIYGNLNVFGLKISLDVSDYKAKKIKNLEREVKKICKEVLNTKVDVKLDPMNSYERRIVHSIVGDYDNLSSISEGEEPNRYTVIKYKD